MLEALLDAAHGEVTQRENKAWLSGRGFASLISCCINVVRNKASRKRGLGEGGYSCGPVVATNNNVDMFRLDMMDCLLFGRGGG